MCTYAQKHAARVIVGVCCGPSGAAALARSILTRRADLNRAAEAATVFAVEEAGPVVGASAGAAERSASAVVAAGSSIGRPGLPGVCR